MSWPQLLNCGGILFSVKSCRLVSTWNTTVCLHNNMERHTCGYEKRYLYRPIVGHMDISMEGENDQ